jgi:hypothetical protein
MMVDATSVYWGDYGNGLIMTCPVGGCGSHPTTLVSGINSLSGVAMDAASVYWAAGGNSSPIAIEKCAKSGCNNQPTIVSGFGIGAGDGTIPVALAVDATSVYWLAESANGGANGSGHQVALYKAPK